jgi:hypothetical protein
LLKKAQTSGWKNIDLHKLEHSLIINTSQCYESLCSITFKNIATDIIYTVKFDNFKKKWIFRVKDSLEKAVDIEDKKAFFSSETFKKTVTRANETISYALALVKHVL